MKQYGVKDEWIVNWRGSELCRKARDYVRRGKQCPLHMYESEQDVHLDTTDKALLDEKRPNLKDTDDKWRDYGLFCVDYFKQHKDRLFDANRRSEKCLLHPGCACPTTWVDSRAPVSRAVTVSCMSPPCQAWCPGGFVVGIMEIALLRGCRCLLACQRLCLAQ